MASSVTTNDTTWATPRTWTTGELVTKTIMDAHVRDELNALKTPASFRCWVDEATNVTTTSTTWTGIDGTNLSATMVTGGGTIYVGFSGTFYFTVSTGRIFLDVIVDGTTRVGTDDGIIADNSASTSATAAMAFVVPITGLSAASHTFAMQWRVTAGTASLLRGDGTANLDGHPIFWGREQ